MTGLMMGFQNKFFAETLKVSPHITVTEEELVPPSRSRAGCSAPIRWPLYHARPPERPARSRSRVRWSQRRSGCPASRPAREQLVGQAILAYADKTYPVELRGIEPAPGHGDSDPRLRGAGRFEALETSLDAIVLGSGVAESWARTVGDRATAAAGPGGTHVRSRWWRCSKPASRPSTRPARSCRSAPRSRCSTPRRGQQHRLPHRGHRSAPDAGRGDRAAVRATRPRAGRSRTPTGSASSRFQQMVTRLVVGFLAGGRRVRDPQHPHHDRAREEARHRHPASIGLTRRQILRIFLVQGS